MSTKDKHKKDKHQKKVLAPKIAASEMEKGKILGQGMFGVVYLGTKIFLFCLLFFFSFSLLR